MGKAFSSSNINKEERVSCEDDDVPIKLISGFVICVTDRKWWLACVLQLSPDESQVKVSLLHPAGPSTSLRYPASECIVMVRVKDI